MGHEILKTWVRNSYEDQRYIQSLDGGDCVLLIRVCVSIISK
jgi:hypothetical protein